MKLITCKDSKASSNFFSMIAFIFIKSSTWFWRTNTSSCRRRFSCFAPSNSTWWKKFKTNLINRGESGDHCWKQFCTLHQYWSKRDCEEPGLYYMSDHNIRIFHTFEALIKEKQNASLVPNLLFFIHLSMQEF